MIGATKATNRKNLSLLAFSLVVVMLGFGMVIPILPFYIQQFHAGGSAFGGLGRHFGSDRDDELANCCGVVAIAFTFWHRIWLLMGQFVP
jgi:hypothetical protein